MQSEIDEVWFRFCFYIVQHVPASVECGLIDMDWLFLALSPVNVAATSWITR